MKTTLSFFILVSIFLSFGFSNGKVVTSPKVLQAFNQTFKSPKDVEWSANANEFTAIFTENNIRTCIAYDTNANFLFSRRYYHEENLPFNILLKIKQKYADKKIGIVTELIEHGRIVYSINVEDLQNVYVIESNGNGHLGLKLKFKKQQLS